MTPTAGAGWDVGPDGVLTRSAARVLLLDAQGRVLLVRGHDVDEPDRHWWFTVGGGIDPGETPRAAAVREVREETGIELDESDLVGPVLTRSAIFDFARAHCRQHETFYLARTTSVAPLTRAGWTDLESDVLDDVAWMTLTELRAVTEEVFPVGLADLLAGLAHEWDGVVRHLGDQHE